MYSNTYSQTHTQFLIKSAHFVELLQFRPVHTSTLLVTVVAELFTGRMPFLVSKQQQESKEESMAVAENKQINK